MFLTAAALSIQYGIDDRIARFFVDREPPKDNLYWKDKLLYLRPKPGYLFLPMITDLFYRSGIPLEKLLSEEYASTLENIGHFSAEQELGLITAEEAVSKCAALILATHPSCIFREELVEYFNGKQNNITALRTPFNALHRGDYFLFSLCVLDVAQDKFIGLVQTWFALISTLLLLDDAEDVESDRANNDENAFLESGGDEAGFKRITELLAANLRYLDKINSTLSHNLHRSFQRVAEKPFIKQYLNS